jgi:hypothetical protein
VIVRLGPKGRFFTTRSGGRELREWLEHLLADVDPARHVTRRLTRLYQRLGAQSRFQLGLLTARKGWLSEEAGDDDSSVAVDPFPAAIVQRWGCRCAVCRRR